MIMGVYQIFNPFHPAVLLFERVSMGSRTCDVHTCTCIAHAQATQNLHLCVLCVSVCRMQTQTQTQAGVLLHACIDDHVHVCRPHTSYVCTNNIRRPWQYWCWIC